MTRFLSSLVSDIRYAMRGLKYSPVFSLVAVLSLALGIGANTAIFSLLNATMLRLLPVREPGRLVQLTNSRDNESWTNPIWEEIRDHQEALDGVFAWGTTRLNLAQGGEARFVEGIMASGSFFQVLGVPALIGRTFTEVEDRRGCGDGNTPAVLSYGFWQSQHGGSREALGQIIRLDGRPFTIVGVTPPSFFGLEVGRSFDVALPLCSEAALRGAASSLDHRSYWWLNIVGRLKPGSTPELAESGFRSLQPAVREATRPTDWPGDLLATYLQEPFRLVAAGTGVSSVPRGYRQALSILLAVVAIVLVVACANLANLLLARAASRAREMAVRLSIGASRQRLARQLMTESVILGLFGASAGIGVAMLASRLIVNRLSTGSTHVILDLSLDWRVLSFTAAIGILTGVLFGIVPALRAGRHPPTETLREASRSTAAYKRGTGVNRWLVSLQVTLSLVLLYGAALFIRTYTALTTLDPGFDRSNVLIVSADMSKTANDPDQRLTLYDRMLEAMRGIRGVRSAAFSMVTPIGGLMWRQSVQVDGYVPKSEREASPYYNYASPGYFETLGTPIVAGRDFNGHDTATSARVAIVNQVFARRYFGERNPVGSVYRVRQGKEWQSVEIIGIAGDARYRTLKAPVPPTAYSPISQVPRSGPALSFPVFLSIKASRDPAALRSEVVARIGEIHRDISLTFRTLESQVNDSLVQERLMATLSALFGVLALAVAAVGLAGLVSYSVVRRQAELGIRAALGATPGSLVRLVLQDVALLIAVGLAAGAAASLASGQFAGDMLYGLSPTDPPTLAAAAGILTAVSLIAAYLPARRAARMDPLTSLRAD